MIVEFCGPGLKAKDAEEILNRSIRMIRRITITRRRRIAIMIRIRPVVVVVVAVVVVVVQIITNSYGFARLGGLGEKKIEDFQAPSCGSSVI